MVRVRCLHHFVLQLRTILRHRVSLHTVLSHQLWQQQKRDLRDGGLDLYFQDG